MSSVCMYAPPNNSPIVMWCDVILLNQYWTVLTEASNGGGQNSLSSSQLSNVPSSKLTASSNSSQKTTKEFNFQTIHETFGKEIEQDLKERRRLKELAQRPLIEFWNWKIENYLYFISRMFFFSVDKNKSSIFIKCKISRIFFWELLYTFFYRYRAGEFDGIAFLISMRFWL